MKPRVAAWSVVAVLATAILCVTRDTSDAASRQNINIIAGTGISATPVDNFSTGQQDWTLSATSGGVSSVTGGTDLSCSPTTGAVTCSVTTVGAPNGGTGVASPTAHTVPIAEAGSNFTFISPSTAGFVLTSNGTGSDPSFQAASGGGAVSSVTGTSPITCSPTTGAVTCSLSTPLSTLNGGSGRNGLNSGDIVVGAGASPVNFIAPGTSGNIVTDNGTNWVSSPLSFNTLTFNGSVQSNIIFDQTIPTPIIGASVATQTPTSDRQPANLAISAAPIFPSAVTNLTGADLSLSSGAGSTAGVTISMKGGTPALGTGGQMQIAAPGGIMGNGAAPLPLMYAITDISLTGVASPLTLSAAQYAFAYLLLGGSLSHNITIIFPCPNPGFATGRWTVDTQQITFNGFTIFVANGTGIVALPGSGALTDVLTPAVNTVYTK